MGVLILRSFVLQQSHLGYSAHIAAAMALLEPVEPVPAEKSTPDAVEIIRAYLMERSLQYRQLDAIRKKVRTLRAWSVL